MKLGQNVFLDEISDLLENGSGQTKTRSVGHILAKPCVRSRGHIFSQIIVKLGQKVCLDEILNEFEKRLCRVKNLVTRSNLRKPCVHSKGHIFCPIIMKRGQNVCLDEISDYGSSHTRSVSVICP